jgi:eukaryotic-like serine/threonine-protein kinase
MTPSRDPLQLVGTTIADKYRVESVVGEGGFAVVYKAMHLVWKRPVAIKAFRALGDFSEERRAQLVDAFIQEGALLGELSERSAAIVQARDVGTITTPDGRWMPYMVLEWLEGATLDAVLDEERGKGAPLRDAEQAMTLLEPVAEALALAHDKGIAHRDVKPANVFVLGDARRSGVGIKLLDFGIAKVVQDAQKMAGSFNETGGHITSFTPAYGAPEQFSRSFGATGPWTDVYALGLIFSEIVSGRAAIDGASLPELAYASCDKTRRPTPRVLGAAVTDEVEAVLARALAVSPNERFASAGELWRALREAIRPTTTTRTAVAPASSGLPGAPPPSMAIANRPTGTVETMDPATTSKRAPRGATSAIVVGAGLATVVGLGIGGFLLTRHGAPKPTAASATAPASAPAVASVASAAPAACPAGMLRIPGGRFFMGSDERDALDLERPAHQVTLHAYCIDELEVTTESYKKCSDQGECKRARDNEWEGITEKERKAFDPLCNGRDPEGKAKHPINCVDWDMATKYCAWQKKRLPTEAEWEFSARGPDGRKYPWGDEAPTAAHLNACGKECVAWNKAHGMTAKAMYDADDGFATTAPVGSFSPGKSRYGVQDVVGNVWEWTSDWHADYTADAARDPTGPDKGDDRVIRGGGWNGSEASWVRPTFRYHAPPTKRSHGVGFRCAAD